MKKLLLLSLISMTILISSCKKEKEIDYTKPENLVGTTWKANFSIPASPDLEYKLLKFTSTTEVEIWDKYKGDPEIKNSDQSYSITGITIKIAGIEGKISGKSMTFTLGSEAIIYNKQ